MAGPLSFCASRIGVRSQDCHRRKRERVRSGLTTFRESDGQEMRCGDYVLVENVGLGVSGKLVLVLNDWVAWEPAPTFGPRVRRSARVTIPALLNGPLIRNDIEHYFFK